MPFWYNSVRKTLLKPCEQFDLLSAQFALILFDGVIEERENLVLNLNRARYIDIVKAPPENQIDSANFLLDRLIVGFGETAVAKLAVREIRKFSDRCQRILEVTNQ